MKVNFEEQGKENPTKCLIFLSKGGTGVLQYVNKKKIAEVPTQYNVPETSRWLKTSVRQHVKDIDSDTIITEDLSEIDAFEGDIGAVLNMHVLAGTHPEKKYLKFWAKRDGWTYSDDFFV